LSFAITTKTSLLADGITLERGHPLTDDGWRVERRGRHHRLAHLGTERISGARTDVDHKVPNHRRVVPGAETAHPDVDKRPLSALPVTPKHFVSSISLISRCTAMMRLTRGSPGQRHL